jgi:hypothetical protein
LRYLAHREGLKIRLTASPLYAADRVAWLAGNEMAFSGRAGYINKYKRYWLRLSPLGEGILLFYNVESGQTVFTVGFILGSSFLGLKITPRGVS